MKKILFIAVIGFTLLFSACTKYNDGTQLPYVEELTGDDELTELVTSADWKTTSIAEGIVWKYFHFPNIFTSRQYITVFDIDMSKNIKLDIAHAGQGNFFTTSEAGELSQADAAINGSYFGTTYGNNTTYFKKGGVKVTPTVAGFDSFRENAAFTISTSGQPGIVRKPSGGWDQVSAPTMLAAGPLLVYDGQLVPQLVHVFNTARHPRTVVGITENNHMLMVVVDGRSSQSQGLTTVQLSELMLSLGCVQAMNMDGGGSSTAWTQPHGVVNHPTDNGIFDNEGQREVSTVIVATAP